MYRRTFLQSPAWLSAQTHQPPPQEAIRPLLARRGVKPLTMAADHVLTELGDRLAGRRPPATVAELGRRRRQVKAALLDSLGLNPFPERTPLRAKVVDERRGPATPSRG